jgi:SAM-dependent methyltransferase
MTQQLAPYLLGHGKPELERLRQQPLQLAAEADWLLDRMEIAPGGRVIEFGCGPRGVLDRLSERVGPAGTVVGIDQGSEAVTLAQTFVEEHGLANVEVRHGNAADTGFDSGSFDAVFTRLVLVNVPNPEAIVAEAARLVRPGGVVAFHEADFVSHLCEPPCDAWSRLLDAYLALFSASGIDLHVGRRVPGLLRAAGLEDVEARPIVHLYPAGHPRRSILTQFVGNVRNRLVGEGFLTGAEVDELTAAVESHVADPNTMVISHLFLQSWGRKPGSTTHPWP